MGKSRKKNVTKVLQIGDNIKYDQAIGKLSGSFPSEIAVKLGQLFQNEDFKTMNVDTFITNIEEALTFFKKRNYGILRKDKSYISEDDVINLVKRYPRLLSQDTKEILEKRAMILDNLTSMNQNSVNLVLKNSCGYIYSIGDDKIYKTLTFLDELSILDSGKKENSAEYVLTTLGEKNLQVSSEKIFQRLLNIVTLAGTTTIPKKDFDFCFKRNDEEYKRRYGITKEQLDEMYILPRTENREEYKETIKYIVERQANKTQKQKGEE